MTPSAAARIGRRRVELLLRAQDKVMRALFYYLIHGCSALSYFLSHLPINVVRPSFFLPFRAAFLPLLLYSRFSCRRWRSSAKVR